MHLCYVGVNSADIALERIAHRVAVGGMASIMMRCDGPKMDGPWLVDGAATGESADDERKEVASEILSRICEGCG